MQINIIFGPPGTGKTTELQRLLLEELKTYDINEIAYVSFTKEGAEQGKRRAAEKLNIPLNSLEHFRTLHSMAFRALNMRRSNVIGKKDYKLFADKMGMRFTGYYTEEFYHTDDRYLFFDILHRNNARTAKQYLDKLDSQVLQFVRKNYVEFKKFYGIRDFTDIIEDFNRNNQCVPVKVAFVDEAQDLTTLQWRMVWTAFKYCDKVYIAGDDDQAIYEWSGADVDYFLRIEADNRSILKKSYRLPRSVLSYSKRISALITNRVVKDYEGVGENGEVQLISSVKEIDFKNTKESWMILCRNRIFLKDVVQHLRDQGVVYNYNKEPSVNHRKIEAINLYERSRKAGTFTEETVLKLKMHLKNFDDTTSPWFDVFNWEDEEIMYYRDLVRDKTDTKICNVYVNTIHSVKGAEADNVVLLSDITKQVLDNVQKNPDSERRVFYVGATRAKRRLFIVNSHSKYEFNLTEYL